MVRLNPNILAAPGWSEIHFNSTMVRLNLAEIHTVEGKEINFNSTMVRLNHKLGGLNLKALAVFQFHYG